MSNFATSVTRHTSLARLNAMILIIRAKFKKHKTHNGEFTYVCLYREMSSLPLIHQFLVNQSLRAISRDDKQLAERPSTLSREFFSSSATKNHYIINNL